MKFFTGIITAIFLLATAAFSYGTGLKHGSERADLSDTIVRLQSQLAENMMDREALATVVAALQSITAPGN